MNVYCFFALIINLIMEDTYLLYTNIYVLDDDPFSYCCSVFMHHALSDIIFSLLYIEKSIWVGELLIGFRM